MGGTLVGAAVDYECNVENEETNLIFQIQILTSVPVDGGLKISGPEGFVAAVSCPLQAAPKERGSPYKADPTADSNLMVPSDAQRASATTGGSLEITVTAGSQGIQAGRYRLEWRR